MSDSDLEIASTTEAGKARVKDAMVSRIEGLEHKISAMLEHHHPDSVETCPVVGMTRANVEAFLAAAKIAAEASAAPQ